MRRRPRRSGLRIANICRTPIRYSREVVLANIEHFSTISNVFVAQTFTLANHLTNYTEFTAMFDQYRLRSVVYKVRMMRPPEAASTGANSQYYPDIYVTVDHDDSTVPTSVNEIQQYGKCKSGILKPNYWFKYKCYPTAAMQLYRTATSTAYAPLKNNTWIDCSYTDVPFYGIKVGIDCTSFGAPTSNQYYEVRCYMTWEFKNSR